MSNNHKNKDVSMSGEPIWRHEKEKEWEPPIGIGSIEEIIEHIKKYFGNVDIAFHEILSDTVHIDVHCVKPTPERPFQTFITSGMSDRPMTIPDDVETPTYMELMISLPPDWKTDDESLKNENWYWPIRQLKYLARFPHKFDTWFGYGHTIPNGDPPVPFSDNTQLLCSILIPPTLVDSEFIQLEINETKTIHFASIVPIYKEEMNLKLRKGTEALIDKFDKYEITELVDINRKNVAKNKWIFF